MAGFHCVWALFPLLTVLISHVHSQDVSTTDTPESDTGFCYCLQNFVSELSGPVGSVFLEDAGEDSVIIVEQIGQARLYRKTGQFVRVFMDIQDRVVVTDTMGESRGLLSLVLDPAYGENGKVYVYYIRSVDGEDWAYVSSFTTYGGVVNPDTEMALLRIYQPYVHGNGGPMMFGDDGFLYIVTGDGGLEDDPDGKAQDKNTFHGKVLRIDVSGPQSFSRGESGVGKLYGIPDSNPFINTSDALEEVYAYGIRNMWGCSVDSAVLGGTGRIFCAETGTNLSDEINIIKSGLNYGWNIKEGGHCVQPGNCSQLENEGVPIYEFPHTSQHSLVGGYVYRGSAFPSLHSKAMYIYGDVVQGKLYTLEEMSSLPWTTKEWPHCELSKCPSDSQATPSPHIFGFGRDLEGELYVLMANGFVPTQTTGKMFKVMPQSLNSSLRLSSSLWMTVLATVVIWLSNL